MRGNKASKKDKLLAVLKDHKWHDGAEFLGGDHGFRLSSYSQRIGDLIKGGYRIERDRRGYLGRYRLKRDDCE